MPPAARKLTVFKTGHSDALTSTNAVWSVKFGTHLPPAVFAGE